MRILLCLLLLAALAGIGMADVNVTGRWVGTFHITGSDGETSDSTALLVLKQTGTEISGTVGPNDDEQVTIQAGKIDGDKITLQAEHKGHTIKFDLVLAADRITGEANMTGEGQTAKAKIDVTRGK